MNHGSSPVKVSVDQANTAYTVDDVYFVMSGQWNIRLRFVAVNGIPLEMVSIPVTVQAAGQ